MYEPKYKLNTRDAKRYHALVVRECITSNLTGAALEKAKRSRKFRPLTDAEKVELEALQKKRSKKIMAHPRVKEQFRRSRNANRSLRRTVKKLQDQIRANGVECNIYEEVYGRKNKVLTNPEAASKVPPMKAIKSET